MERISQEQLDALEYRIEKKLRTPLRAPSFPVVEWDVFIKLVRAYRTPTGLDREQVARIIDSDWDGERFQPRLAGGASIRAYRYADAIIALGVVASPEGNSAAASLPVSEQTVPEPAGGGEPNLVSKAQRLLGYALSVERKNADSFESSRGPGRNNRACLDAEKAAWKEFDDCMSEISLRLSASPEGGEREEEKPFGEETMGLICGDVEVRTLKYPSNDIFRPGAWAAFIRRGEMKTPEFLYAYGQAPTEAMAVMVAAKNLVLSLALPPEPEAKTGGAEWKCKARTSPLPESQDCDWPQCGCDPHATRVIEALEEEGLLASAPSPAPAVGVEEITAARLREWFVSRPGISWKATVKDIDEALADLSTSPLAKGDG